MQRASGFTLIELMITLAVIGILSAIAYPSYQQYIQRGIRSQGQQFLTDLAQRQEQYFLDQRAYATGLGVGVGLMNIPIPPEVASRYAAPVFTPIAGPPLGFRISIAPLNPGRMAGDGTLVINNLQQRWREVDNNNTYNAKATPTAPGDCLWEDSRCTPL